MNASCLYLFPFQNFKPFIMKKILLLTILFSITFWGCKNELTTPNSAELENEIFDGGDHAHDHGDWRIEWIETVDDNTEKSEERNSNPHGLAAGIHSPYPGLSETHINWTVPGHHRPWGGDWATDLWVDNGNAWSNYTWSCNYDVSIDARAITYPGGKAPQALKAKLLSHGYACASHNFADGGFAQKWEIVGTYNGVDYKLGWVLYAHLAYVEYTGTGTVINLNGKTKIARSFWNTQSTACSGSCHIHIEFLNYRGYSCYDINSPLVQIDRVGILGGNASGGHCPNISNGPVKFQPVNCIRSSAYNGASDCNRAYDNNVYTKWTSNGHSQQSSMVVDLGSVKNVRKIVVKHASSGGEPTYYNTKYFKIEYGSSGIWGPWTHSGYGHNWNQQKASNTMNVNFNARYVHLYIINPGIDNHARIPEFEVYGY